MLLCCDLVCAANSLDYRLAVNSVNSLRLAVNSADLPKFYFIICNKAV